MTRTSLVCLSHRTAWNKVPRAHGCMSMFTSGTVTAGVAQSTWRKIALRGGGIFMDHIHEHSQASSQRQFLWQCTPSRKHSHVLLLHRPSWSQRTPLLWVRNCCKKRSYPHLHGVLMSFINVICKRQVSAGKTTCYCRLTPFERNRLRSFITTFVVEDSLTTSSEYLFNKSSLSHLHMD